MNCCNEYGNCTQGHDCPARVAKIGQRMHGPEPLPLITWRDYLQDLARGLLLCLAVIAVSAAVVGVMTRT